MHRLLFLKKCISKDNNNNKNIMIHLFCTLLTYYREPTGKVRTTTSNV